MRCARPPARFRADDQASTPRSIGALSAMAVSRISRSVIPVSLPPLGRVVVVVGAGAAVAGEGPMTTVGFRVVGTVFLGTVRTGRVVEVEVVASVGGTVVTDPGGVRTDWFPPPPVVRATPTPIAMTSATATDPTMTTDLRSTIPSICLGVRLSLV
jgi:hypothetical protein